MAAPAWWRTPNREGSYTERYPAIEVAQQRYWTSMERHNISEHGQDLPEIQNWRWEP